MCVEMSADHPAACNSGPVVSHTRHLAAGRQSPPPNAPRLCFDRCAMAPETRPLPAVLHAHPPTTSTDCPAASDGEGEGRHGNFLVRRPQADRPLRFPSRAAPVAPSPGRFATFWMHQAGYVDRDRSMGSRCRPETNSIGDWPAITPLPFTPLPAIQLQSHW